MRRWLSGSSRNSQAGERRVTGTATFDFSGKVALITGGTEGIGLATAIAFPAQLKRRAGSVGLPDSAQSKWSNTTPKTPQPFLRDEWAAPRKSRRGFCGCVPMPPRMWWDIIW